MRILFVNSIQMFAGGEVWMLRALKGLAERGHKVFLLCRPGTELAQRAQQDGLPVRTLRIRGDFDPFTILATALFIRKNKIQIVLTNMDKELRFAGLAARLVGHCAVIPRRGIDYPLKNRLQYRLSYTKLADCVIANSRATRQALLRNAPWLDPAKIYVVYNGIDPAPFTAKSRYDMRQKWAIARRALIIGFVGQLDARKGIATLLDAFRSIADKVAAHLVLSGTGPLKDFILRFAQQHNLESRIHLLGFQEHIEEVMKALDVLVLPSLWEGFGIVLIEAMAAAKPVVTTAVSSMPEIVVDHVTGLVVPVENVEALSLALLNILTHKKYRQSLGENGRQRMLGEFTLNGMLDQLESIFYSHLK